MCLSVIGSFYIYKTILCGASLSGMIGVFGLVCDKFQHLSVASTMQNCVGFLNGAIANSYTAQTGTSTPISTTVTSGIITITF